MELITEDTPEGGVDELNWTIEQLREALKKKDQHIEQLNERLRVVKRLFNESQENYLRLTGLLTVGTLRSIGVNVSIELPESDEDYEDE